MVWAIKFLVALMRKLKNLGKYFKLNLYRISTIEKYLKVYPVESACSRT